MIMPNKLRRRHPLAVTGLCAFLTLGAAGCSSMSDEEGGSTPVGEEMFEGDDRDEAPAHQEHMREGRSVAPAEVVA